MNDMNPDIESMVQENRRRNDLLRVDYDPLRGLGCCGPRRRLRVPWEAEEVYLPETMLADSEYDLIADGLTYQRLRLKHDFEYWCARCVCIRHKLTGRSVPFVLNAPQRRVVSEIERRRLAGVPIRMVLLKARQWGGSTLVQMYFAWIQVVHRTDWNSLICAHVKSTAVAIRRMYSRMLAEYPEELWPCEEKPKFKAVTNASDTREISGRRSCVTLSSSYGQDASRGLDCSMVHLSEVAFWKNSENKSPADYVRAVAAGVPLEPLTFIALESTANGVGDFFHARWLQAKEGDTGDIAVFVPWYEIEMYRLPVDDVARFVGSWNEYERGLWKRGLTLEMIMWYRVKSGDIGQTAMLSEYPTDDLEAFVHSGSAVFAPEKVEALRGACIPAVEVGEVCGEQATGRGALRAVRFVPLSNGFLKVWRRPDVKPPAMMNRYVVSVDVGGRSRGSDYSVIAVFDRFSPDASGHPEVVAQWRGHCDHDLLGWRAAAIARWYHNALLVIESNSLETSAAGHSRYILEELNGVYHNMYVRRKRDSTSPGACDHAVGFHTNVLSKALIVTTLIACVRDGGYVERDDEACNEMMMYERDASGHYHAKAGHHDDILMTRAMGLYVISTLPVVEMPDSSTISGFKTR